MTRTHRVVVTAPRAVSLEPAEVASPGPGEVLIRAERTLISTGTELTAITGDFPPNSAWAAYIQYPCPLGYSHVGCVAEVGEGVPASRLGERVLSMACHTGWALRPSSLAWQVPDGVDPEAASFAVLVEIVMGGVRRGRVAFGESVVVV